MTNPLDELRTVVRMARRSSPEEQWADALQTIVHALQLGLQAMYEEGQIDGFVDTLDGGDGAMLWIARDDRRPAMVLRRGGDGVEIVYGNVLKRPEHGEAAWDFVETGVEGGLALHDVTQNAVINALTAFMRHQIEP